MFLEDKNAVMVSLCMFSLYHERYELGVPLACIVLHHLTSIRSFKSQHYTHAYSVPQCSSPEWAKVVILEHTRGTEHRIAIDIFHSLLSSPEKQHTIAHSERRGHLHVDHAQHLCGILLDVETILCSRDCILTEKLSYGCSITVRLEECSSQANGEFKFQLRGLDCQNTRINFLDRPDFVMEIRRKQPGKTQDTWCVILLL